MRVLGLATRTFERLPQDLGPEDEAAMIFCGFLAFLDPPKDCAFPCIRELHSRGVAVKVLLYAFEAHLAIRPSLSPLRGEMRKMFACCICMPYCASCVILMHEC